jgi:hypothetical protein
LRDGFGICLQGEDERFSTMLVLSVARRAPDARRELSNGIGMRSSIPCA